jgi:two-component system response regulator GlrR
MTPHRLLVIAQAEIGMHCGLAPVLKLESGFDCRHGIWDPSRPLDISQTAAELVLFVTPAQMDDPLRFFSWLRKHPVETSSIAVLPEDADKTLLHLASNSVNDFVVSPVKGEELRCRVARLLGIEVDEELSIRQRLKQELGLAQLLGEDRAFVHVLQSIPGIAASDAPVLLLGETGTGKELCAQAIHNLSPRQNGPFIPVECGAIPENLVENELFGHVRGAFTDAHCDQKGFAALAEGGTLFLDEIDSLPMPAQAKLLRFIQEGTYRPLGSQKIVSSNLRLVVASNRDLESCIREGKFRSDLYFRLNVLPLRLPPLRERRRDIVLLAKHFLMSVSMAGGQPGVQFSPAALQVLQSHDWPGNVRELLNAVRRAVVFSNGSTILPPHLGLPVSAEPAPDGDFRQAKARVIENFEKTYLEQMLTRHDGNVTHSAREAGKDRRVFGRLMKRYKITRRAS